MTYTKQTDTKNYGTHSFHFTSSLTYTYYSSEMETVLLVF